MQPINIYYSIDVNVYDQVLLSIISLIKTNPNNTLHIYLLSHKYKLKTISKKELNLLRTIIKQGSKDNKIFIVDVTELMTKYMLTGPNEHWEDTDHFVKNYKHISLLYVRFLIVFIPNVPKKILWLDSDTIIMKDILPLWNINIEKHNLAAAIDHGTFFQNAVMLLNLNPKSKDNIIKIFTDVCKFYKTTNYGAWGDMKVINKLKKIYQLDNIYNSWQPLKKTVIFHYCHLFNITKFSDKKHEFFYNLKLKKDRRMLWVSKKDMPNKKSIKIESPIFWKKYKKLQHWNLALESAKSTINK